MLTEFQRNTAYLPKRPSAVKGPCTRKDRRGATTMRSKKVSLAIINVILGLAITVVSSASAQQTPQILDGKTAGQVFKNIKVLTDTPADQLNQSMHVIKAAVGLDCEDCHVDGDFPADAKRPKLIARQMMQMVMDLNKSSFKGQPEITCYTCHRGNPDPVSMPTLPIVEASREANVALPTVDQILAKYVEALGGDNALRKVTSRVIAGTQYLPTGPGGVVPTPATIERDLKAPNLVVNIYRTPTYTISDGFDGSAQWSQNMQGRVVDAGRVDQERAKRAADFYEPLNLRNEYVEMTVGGTERVDGRDAYVVIGRPEHDLPEQLYFDIQTGLLVRKRTVLQTPTGNSPFQVTYADYRDTGNGVKFPYLIRLDPAGARVELATTATIYVTKVQDNAPIADNKFTKPVTQAGPAR